MLWRAQSCFRSVNYRLEKSGHILFKNIINSKFRLSIWFLENRHLIGRDDGLYEGDMRFTKEQALKFKSGSGDVRSSIPTGKWPGAVLAYEIAPSLRKLFRSQSLNFVS